MADVKSGSDEPAGISKAEFAYRLRFWMDSFKFQNTWLAEKMGKDEGTISHYRSDSEKKLGVPSEAIRREIEYHLGMPDLTLDGKGDIKELARARRGKGTQPPTFNRQEWDEEPYELWMDKPEAEDRLDYLLHWPERLMKMLSSPDLFTRDTVLLYRLGVLTGCDYVHERLGKPAYPYLRVRRQQVMDGTYR